MRQGKVLAENIAAALGVGQFTPFAYKPIGMLASLGRQCAVAEICGFKFSGLFAWWLWRTIYLLKRGFGKNRQRFKRRRASRPAAVEHLCAGREVVDSDRCRQ
jgi:NADH dehydrogenase FAD-containing subunit